MQGLKTEFPPLLPPGFHEIPLEEYEDHFVTPFNSQARRQHLVDQFRLVCDLLKSFGFTAEIWVDGSFLTEKPEPGDIDIVCFLPTNVLSAEARNTVSILMKEAKVRYGCHFNVAPQADKKAAETWGNFFGVSRRQQPKGIAILKVNSHE